MVTALLNIVLDFLFLVVFRWGVAAAAAASCLSIALGTVLGFLPFVMGRLPLRFVRGTISARQLGNILANGSSEFFSSIAGSVMMVILNSVLLRLSGSMAVAAFSIVMYVDSIVGSLLFGMADSIQPAISYNYGARRRDRMLALEKRVLLTGAAVSLAALLWMQLGGQYVIPLFIQGDDPALLEMSLRAMRLFSLSYLLGWAGTCLQLLLHRIEPAGTLPDPGLQQDAGLSAGLSGGAASRAGAGRRVADGAGGRSADRRSGSLVFDRSAAAGESPGPAGGGGYTPGVRPGPIIEKTGPALRGAQDLF